MPSDYAKLLGKEIDVPEQIIDGGLGLFFSSFSAAKILSKGNLSYLIYKNGGQASERAELEPFYRNLELKTKKALFPDSCETIFLKEDQINWDKWKSFLQADPCGGPVQIKKENFVSQKEKSYSKASQFALEKKRKETASDGVLVLQKSKELEPAKSTQIPAKTLAEKQDENLFYFELLVFSLMTENRINTLLFDDVFQLAEKMLVPKTVLEKLRHVVVRIFNQKFTITRNNLLYLLDQNPKATFEESAWQFFYPKGNSVKGNPTMQLSSVLLLLPLGVVDWDSWRALVQQSKYGAEREQKIGAQSNGRFETTPINFAKYKRDGPEYKKQVIAERSAINDGRNDLKAVQFLKNYMRKKGLSSLSFVDVSFLLSRYFNSDFDTVFFYQRAFHQQCNKPLTETRITEYLRNVGVFKKPLESHNESLNIPENSFDVARALIDEMEKRGIGSLSFPRVVDFCRIVLGDQKYAKQLLIDAFAGTRHDTIFLSSLKAFLSLDDRAVGQKYVLGTWPWIECDERGPIDPREIVGGINQILRRFPDVSTISLLECKNFLGEHYPMDNSLRKYLVEIGDGCPMGKIAVTKLKKAKLFYEDEYFKVANQ